MRLRAGKTSATVWLFFYEKRNALSIYSMAVGNASCSMYLIWNVLLQK